MRKKLSKRTVSTVVLVAVFLVGLSLLLYPSVSDWWNSMHQSRAIVGYAEAVAGLDNEDYEAVLEEAQAYNASLVGKADRFNLSDEELEEYEGLLSVDGTEVIGYVEIDKIDCYLPIYHGTSSAVLQVGVGHLEGSSLPVGGESTHAVISGHRGLPSAELFTNLDQLEVGDTFTITVLDETLTYEVDQIRIVEPTDFSELAIEEGEDLCTLMTCTPYGINTHRLLVRGHRVESAGGGTRVSADAMQVEPTVVAPVVAVPLLVVLLAGVLVRTRRASRARAVGAGSAVSARELLGRGGGSGGVGSGGPPGGGPAGDDEVTGGSHGAGDRARNGPRRGRKRNVVGKHARRGEDEGGTR